MVNEHEAVTADGVVVGVGDWVFYKFELVQIQRIEKGKIHGVSSGSFSYGGNSLCNSCASLTLANNCLCSTFRYYYDKIHATNDNSLNYPDISNKFVELWINACVAVETEKGESEALCQKADNFYQQILNATAASKEVFVEGVRLHR